MYRPVPYRIGMYRYVASIAWLSTAMATTEWYVPIPYATLGARHLSVRIQVVQQVMISLWFQSRHGVIVN
jgi:hypothetical protein